MEGIGKRYEYVLDDVFIECVLKEKFMKEFFIDLFKFKEVVKLEEFVEKWLFVEVYFENDKRLLFVVMEEFSNLYEFFKYFNKLVYFCWFCDIIFLNCMIFYLYKGFYNVNNLW